MATLAPIITVTPMPISAVSSAPLSFSDTLSIIALIVSGINLLLYLYSVLWRERTGLRITQDLNEPSYSLGFVYYQEYRFVFAKIRIENKTKTAVTISNFTLVDKAGNKYIPSNYEIPEVYNERGLCLDCLPERREYMTINLRSENLLRHTRIEDHGCSEGFLVFFDVPLIEKEEKIFILHSNTPTKKYKTKIVVKKLPDNLRSTHHPLPEAKSHAM